jgi:hypothetical protein
VEYVPVFTIIFFSGLLCQQKTKQVLFEITGKPHPAIDRRMYVTYFSFTTKEGLRGYGPAGSLWRWRI